MGSGVANFAWSSAHPPATVSSAHARVTFSNSFMRLNSEARGVPIGRTPDGRTRPRNVTVRPRTLDPTGSDPVLEAGSIYPMWPGEVTVPR